MTMSVNAFAATGVSTCPWAFVHASDRARLPRYASGRYEPRYPLFNKMVLCRTCDAVVCISFAGLAVLEGMPLDCWIASKVTGQDLRAHLGISLDEPQAYPIWGWP